MSETDRNAAAPCMAYVTCGSEDEARAIARAVLGERLAACANVIPGMRSLYSWQGEVREDVETVLILKTRRAKFSALAARVVALHSYDVPCVVEIPLGDGHPDYLGWIAAETDDGAAEEGVS